MLEFSRLRNRGAQGSKPSQSGLQSRHVTINTWWTCGLAPDFDFDLIDFAEHESISHAF